MENQDKLYNEFKEAAQKAEDKGFARMEAVWNRVEDKLDNKKQRRIAIWWKYTGIAALLLLFTGMGFMLLKNNSDVIVPQTNTNNKITVIDTQKVKQTVAPGVAPQPQQQVTVVPAQEQQPTGISGQGLSAPKNTESIFKDNVEKTPIVFTGTVVDETGLPAPGINVVVDGTQNATVTDIDGKYVINAAVGDTISLNAIGYLERTVVADQKNNSLNVALQPDNNSLEEVVVVGYGTYKKKETTGAVTTITSKTIEGRPNASFTQSLQGQVPGVNITSNALNNGAYNSASANTNWAVQNATSPGKKYRDGDMVSQNKTATDEANDFNKKVAAEPLASDVTLGYVIVDKNREKETDKDGVADDYDVLANGRIQNRALPGQITQTQAEPAGEVLEKALQGQVSGVTITNGSGQPGANSTIILRGNSSTTSIDPLYVIDGVPMNVEDFRKLNPNDIESVSVLKDAGATAVFGNRGVNGVIVVKTKNAKPLTKRQERKQQRDLEKYLEDEKEAIEKEERQAREAEEAEQQRLDKIKIPVDTNNDESYEQFEENKFENPATAPLSTFSIDVDNASYTNIRRFLNNGQTVPKDAVRVEEMINFFKYEYPQPKGDDPFSINTEYSECPWNPNHKLLKIGLQGYEIPTSQLPASNFVFLIDVSGSMDAPNKLPLLKESMKMLIKNMRKEDHISIVVYAGAAGLVLPPTSGADKNKIYAALDNLKAGGSTAGGAGIELAYKTAQEHFVKGGNNRVVLATDGDFNVGASSDGDMQTLIEAKRKSGVFLTCLGYGMGNYKDSKLETLADKGNGNYAYIDNMQEADRFLDKEFKGSMFAIAKDVKIQIEFNPKHVQSYRLIGYENRKLRDEDFVNDAIDAGELGSGHTVTALYEIIPIGMQSAYFNPAPELKYSTPATVTGTTYNDELATIKFRHKKPDGDKSIEKVVVIPDIRVALNEASGDFKFAAAVAWFGLKLRDSKLVPDKASKNIIRLAREGLKNDDEGYRAEFIRLANRVE